MGDQLKLVFHCSTLGDQLNGSCRRYFAFEEFADLYRVMSKNGGMFLVPETLGCNNGTFDYQIGKRGTLDQRSLRTETTGDQD